MSDARNPAMTRSSLLPAPSFLLGIVAVLALMWPAIVNRQPFFFSDTTAYVRAADVAVNLASGGAIRTAWTRPGPAAAAGPAVRQPLAKGAAPQPARANSGGNIMSGRSPYFGALLYLSYLASDFWLFVIGQALVAYLLIGSALRCFGIAGAGRHAPAAVLLAALTPLAYCDSLLLADALAGFGILAFLVLAVRGEGMGRGERLFLGAVVVVSAVSHLTHIVMLAGLVAVLAGWAALRRVPWRSARPALLVGVAGVVVGLGSVMLTGAVVRRAFGRPPVLVPLITARFIADGPGRDFVASGCGGRDFVACTLPTGADAQDYLWSRDPRRGVYLFADPATRRRLSDEDTAFGLAVLRAYPLRQGGMLAWNTLRQIGTFDSGFMNQPCFAAAACSADQLPPAVRARLERTPSGHNDWPVAQLSLLHLWVAAAAAIGLLALLPGLLRDAPAQGRLLLLWTVLLATAMLVNGFLGGAISEPQGRYQARIVWLVPLLALIAVACRQRVATRTGVRGLRREPAR